MKETMGIWEFAGDVRRYVKEALPEELSGADVCVASLNTEDGNIHVALLVSRPWNGTATGFYLDGWYERYSGGIDTAESAAASIINDRRLYNMSPRTFCK